MRILPPPVRSQVATAYLLARTADTIADTALLPESARLRSLGELRRGVAGDAAARRELEKRMSHFSRGPAPDQAESSLLAAIDDCLRCFDKLPAQDRGLVEQVLDKLILGMERDLSRFPASDGSGQPVAPQRVVALLSRADLDDYTYYAAGCVGEFWTDLMAAHLPALRSHLQPELHVRGVALGKALQMVNVVRDVAADLRNGRCYWPEEILAENGLTPRELAEMFARPPDAVPAADRAALTATTTTLINLAEELCAISRPYVDAIDKSELRVRLACTWPLQLADETLRALRARKTLLGPPVKVPRKQVYRMLLRSSAEAAADMLRASFAA